MLKIFPVLLLTRNGCPCIKGIPIDKYSYSGIPFVAAMTGCQIAPELWNGRGGEHEELYFCGAELVQGLRSVRFVLREGCAGAGRRGESGSGAPRTVRGLRDMREAVPGSGCCGEPDGGGVMNGK